MKKKYDLSFIFAFILFFFLAIYIKDHPVLSIDLNIYHFIFHTFYSKMMSKIVKMITFLGSAKCLILLNILSYLWITKTKEPVHLTLHLLLGLFSYKAIKKIIKRSRPALLHLVKEGGYSFPSGHTTCAFVFYGYLWLIASKIQNVKKRRIMKILLAFIIILVGLSRIYLGVHYFTDIIGGMLLGYIIIYLYEKGRIILLRQGGYKHE